MARQKRRIIAADCETNPFEYGVEVTPFIWGAYDGDDFFTFGSTTDFIRWLEKQYATVYFHNGGKFDVMFLLNFINPGKINVINGRLVKCKIGKAIIQDSYSIIPVPLKAYQKDEFNYEWLLEENRDERMPEIISYLRGDCKYLWEMVTEYRNLAGDKMTIASNALAFAQGLDIPISKTTKRYDDIFRKFYFGGRCEAFKHGEFENVSVFDIKSAYPFAMIHDHANGGEFREISFIPKGDKVFKCFIELECFSDGAFPLRTKSGLRFPSERNRFFITGWEYVAAMKWGLISDINIVSVLQHFHSINFKPYIDHWFKVKNDAEKRGDKLHRLIAKIMLNSLYGKMAQNPENFKDYILKEGGSELEEYCELHAELDCVEIHTKPKYPEGIEEWKSDFYNVATGASITGFVRAYLLDAIMRVGRESVIYCDTDSIFTNNDDLSGLELGKELGDWDLEAVLSPLHVAGKKMYAGMHTIGDDAGKEKIASKGVRLNFAQIKAISKGATIQYNNPAPSFKLDGTQHFISRKIKATF